MNKENDYRTVKELVDAMFEVSIDEPEAPREILLSHREALEITLALHIQKVVAVHQSEMEEAYALEMILMDVLSGHSDDTGYTLQIKHDEAMAIYAALNIYKLFLADTKQPRDEIDAFTKLMDKFI